MRLEIINGLEFVRGEKLKEIKRKYKLVCEGLDPETGKSIYVDCETASGIFRMDAGADHANVMDGGYRGFADQGFTHMPYIRDFYNDNHAQIPIAVAKVVRDKQFNESARLHQERGALVDAVEAIRLEDYPGEAEAIAALKAIPIVFNVNVE